MSQEDPGWALRVGCHLCKGEAPGAKGVGQALLNSSWSQFVLQELSSMLFRVTEILPSPQVFLLNVDFPKMRAGTNTWISQGCFCCGPTVCQVWPTCRVLLWVCMEWAQP